MINFLGYKCQVIFSKYRNGRTAIRLIDTEDSSPVLTATINIPDIKKLGTDEAIIKNYSENEGVLDTLIDAGYISEPIYWITTGHVSYPVCKLLKTE